MLVIIVLILLLFVSSAIGGVVFWKKDDLFGSVSDTSSETSSETSEPKVLGESCSIDNECKSPLVCDSDNFTCQPAPVPVDCEGSFEDWSECVYPSGNECATVGTKTRQFGKTNDGPKHGGAECPADESESCSGRVVPSSCNVDCVGEWELATCPTNQCGDTTMTETYRITANAVGTGNDCLNTDGETRQKDCPNPCTGSPENCEGDWAPEHCGYRGCGKPSITKTKRWIKTKDAKNGGSCPLENQTHSYTCPATNACHRGEDPRPGNLRGSRMFKNSGKKVQIFKIDGNNKTCLGIKGGDDKFGKNDKVGFYACDREHKDLMNTWKITNNDFIETWHKTDKFKKNGRPQPLCIDYNNKIFKLVDCKHGGGLSTEDRKNRTLQLQDHTKMTWPAESSLVHDTNSYREFSRIAPIRIKATGSHEGRKCIKNGGDGGDRVGNCSLKEQLYITDKSDFLSQFR